MDRTFFTSIVLAACFVLGLAAFQKPTPKQDPPKPEPKPEQTDKLAPGAPVRIAPIPGTDKEKFGKQLDLFAKWFAKDLGRPVEIVPFADFAAALAGILDNKVEMAWLDGQSVLKAEEASKGKCWPMFTREADLKNKSYFITSKKLVDAGTFKPVEERNPMPLEQLAALKPKFAGLSFTFGEKKSTASHFMPRYFLERTEVGIDPEKGFKAKATYAADGGDANVIAKVLSGAADVGVIAAETWEKASDELKTKAPVIFVTPEYMDHCMVLYNRVGPTLSLRLTRAFLIIDTKSDDQKGILDVFGTKAFVSAGPANLTGLREVVKSLKQRGMLE